MSKQSTIWALFSVANNYDQPSNNLEAFWFDRPSLEATAKVLNLKFPGATDEDILTVVNIWQGKEVCIRDTNYRLEEIKEGKVG